MVKNQGGDVSYLDDTSKFKRAEFIGDVYSKKEGKIIEEDAERIGTLACFLGAGRVKKDDVIDMSVGITLDKKVGDYVHIGEKIGTAYASSKEKLDFAVREMERIICIN